MRNLTGREFLDSKPNGRAHLFSQLIDEETYTLEMVRQMRVDLFGGSVERMLVCVAGDDGIDEAKRVRIKQLAGA
jgi:predicted transcriptional regulator